MLEEDEARWLAQLLDRAGAFSLTVHGDSLDASCAGEPDRGRRATGALRDHWAKRAPVQRIALLGDLGYRLNPGQRATIRARHVLVLSWPPDDPDARGH